LQQVLQATFTGIYADSSMEASDGLNPESSQGYADILSVEAIALAKAGQFKGDS